MSLQPLGPLPTQLGAPALSVVQSLDKVKRTHAFDSDGNSFVQPIVAEGEAGGAGL